MPYVDSAGLSRFDSRQKDRIGREYALLRDMQWLRTEKAGAVTCWPVGGTQLKPSVDFLFTETPPAEGDKGPENPSTIAGVSSVKVTRANSNLMTFPYYRTSGYESADITWTVNADGSVSATGTSDGTANFELQNTNNIAQNGILLQTGTYILAGCPANGGWTKWGITVIVRASDIDKITYNSDYGSGSSITVTSPVPVCFVLRIGSGNNVSGLTFYPKLQLVEAPFEKNEQDVYTLPLGGTYYGGTVDLATGVMTVTHAVFVYDGTNLTPSTSNFAEYGERYSLQYYFPSIKAAPPGIGDISIYATDILPLNTPDVDSLYIKSNSAGVDIRMLKSDLNLGDGLTRADVVPAYKAWFADHPLTFVYPRYSPLTVQLSPTEILSLAQTDKYTSRLNTIYTDASAVQVGYVKSPIREEFELQQAVAAQGGGV